MKKYLDFASVNFKSVKDFECRNTYSAAVDYEPAGNQYFYDRATCRDDKEYEEYFGPVREDE